MSRLLMKVLMLDDEKPAEIVEWMLKERGISDLPPPETWIVCKDYKSAIRNLREVKFDVLLMDHWLGSNKTGTEILEYIIAMGKEEMLHVPPKIYPITNDPIAQKHMHEIIDKMVPSSYNSSCV